MEQTAMGLSQGRGTRRERSVLRLLVLAFLIIAATGTVAKAQSVADQLRDMQQAIQDLQQQVNTLRQQLLDTQGALARSEPATAAGGAKASIASVSVSPAESSMTRAVVAAPAPVQSGGKEQVNSKPPPSTETASSAPLPPPAPVLAQTQESAVQQAPEQGRIPLLESEIADLSQVKVESNSRFPVKIFGSVVWDTSYNSSFVNWLDNPTLPVSAPSQTTSPTSLSMSLRQSRLGAIVNGPTLGNWKTSGLVSIDFFAGSTTLVPDSIIPVPRLLYGYARLQHGQTLIEVGQDEMILAPEDPTSIAALAFPEFYLSGNLYARAVQARFQQTFALSRNADFVATAGVVDADSSDSNIVANLAPSGVAWEPPHRPAAQARLAWKWHGSDSGRFEFGVSGHRGNERFPTGVVPSWAGAADLRAQAGRFGITGEWYAGRNLAGFGGAIGQFGKSTGGFGEMRLRASQRLSFNSGYGTDGLFDLRVFPAPVRRNSGVFFNSIYHFTPELAGSVEYRWLTLTPVAGAMPRNNNVDVVLAYSF